MTSNELIARVEESISLAESAKVNLSKAVLRISGFSTPAMRRLFNAMCRKPISKYLEIGAYTGGTICAAASDNPHLDAVTFEDFSQPFEKTNVKAILKSNLRRTLLGAGKITLREEDCWKADISNLKDFEVFFYDGHHAKEFQRKALPHFIDCLTNDFIFMVDDTNWTDVHEGTAEGFEQLVGKVKIVKEWKIRTPGNDHPIWHNGVDIFVCSKEEKKDETPHNVIA